MIDLDHVSFGTHDALATGKRLRRDYGATAVFGEALPEFRYLALYLGTAEHGGFLELLDPNGAGFMTTFLDRFGEAPHHLTFTVPDIEASVQQVKDLGFAVTGENFGHEPWREAFITPHPATGCVIQLAQTPYHYPAPSELLATNERDLDSYPSSQGALDNTWWLPIWEQAAGPAIEWDTITTRSSDIPTLLTIYRDVLGATVTTDGESTICTWPSGTITIESAERSGIGGVRYHRESHQSSYLLSPPW
ncbi:MAG TPA: VOC family protein [Candidatus Nanopelagicales bacterium]|nr:VOC family protein [Candidatus Nanopelagicales bacterium]